MTASNDEKLLESLITYQKNEKLEFSLEIDGKFYILNEGEISKSPTPVQKPTLRGGVYFSDTHEYKIIGKIFDLSIIPKLSKTMLGPNTEFREILVKTYTMINSKKTDIFLYTNLTNSMQSKSKIELNLIIIKAEQLV